MYSITTNYRHVFKIHRSAFYTKISQRIVVRFSGTYVSEDLYVLLSHNNKNRFKKGVGSVFFLLNNCLFFFPPSFLCVSGAIPRRLNPQCRSNACDDRPQCPRTSCRCLFPSRMDCAVYYQCVNGKPFQYRCSPGLLFNDETLSCDYSYNVKCSK